MRFLKRALEAFLILLGLVVLLMQLGPDSDTDEDVDKQLGRGYSPSAGPASPAAPKVGRTGAARQRLARPAAAPLQRSYPLVAASPAGRGLR